MRKMTTMTTLVIPREWFAFYASYFSYTTYRDELDDPEDLWDFGTVRHVGGSGTIGKAAAQPEILEEEDYPVHHVPSQTNGSSGSSNPGEGSTIYGHNMNGYSSSSTIHQVKQDLPLVPPPSVPVIHGTPSNVNKALPVNPGRPGQHGNGGTVRRNDRRDPSYGSEGSDELSFEFERTQLDSPTPPTMLDSVVLPAIASVCRLLA